MKIKQLSTVTIMLLVVLSLTDHLMAETVSNNTQQQQVGIADQVSSASKNQQVSLDHFKIESVGGRCRRGACFGGVYGGLAAQFCSLSRQTHSIQSLKRFSRKEQALVAALLAEIGYLI